MLNQIYLRQTYLMICAQRAFSSRKMCSLWIIFVAGMQQRNHPAKSSVRYQAQHSCCFALSRWFSLPSLQTLQPSTMKMLETCVGHAFSTWKLGNFCGGFYKRKSVSWSSWFLQGMGQWQWPVLPTHCNIYIYIYIYLCVCVSTPTCMIFSLKHRKRILQNWHASYQKHRDGCSMVFLLGQFLPAHTTLVLHGGRKIWFTTQH